MRIEIKLIIVQNGASRHYNFFVHYYYGTQQVFLITFKWVYKLTTRNFFTTSVYFWVE